MNRKLFDAQIAQYATPIVTGGSSVTYKDGIKCYLPHLEASGNTIQTLLPVEYQQVEYIESTGTQYIDTGVFPQFRVNSGGDTSVGTAIRLKYQLQENKGCFICGCRISSNTGAYYHNLSSTGDFCFFFQLSDTGGMNSFNLGKYNTNINEFYFDYKMAEFNGEQFPPTQQVYSFTSTLSLYLFSCNQNNSAYLPSNMRLYSCQIDNLDFIPCYRKSDGVIGLYEITEGKFYTNQGTGTFLKGKDYIPNPQYDAPQTITNFSEKHEEIIAKCKNLIDPDKLAEIIISEKGNQIAEIIEVDGRRCIRYMNSTTNSADFTPAISEPFKPNTQYIFSFEAKPYTPVPETSQYSGNLWFGFKPSGAYAQVGFNGKTDLEFSRKVCVSISGKTVSDIHLSWGAMHSWLIDLDSIYLYEYWGNSNPDYMPHHSIDEYKDEWEELEIGGKNLINPDKLVELIKTYNTWAVEVEVEGRRCIRFSNNMIHAKDFTSCLSKPFKENTRYIFSVEARPNTVMAPDAQYTGSFSIGFKPSNVATFKALNAKTTTEFTRIYVVNNANTTPTDIAFSYGSAHSWLIDLDTVYLYEYEGDTNPEYEPYHEPQVVKIPPKIGNLTLRFAKYNNTYDSLEVDGINKKVIYKQRLDEVVVSAGLWSTKYYYANSMGIYANCLPYTKCARQKGYCSHTTQAQTGGSSCWTAGGLWLGVNSTIIFWIGIISLLGYDADWVDKKNPTTDEWTVARDKFRAWLSEHEKNGNPFRCIYVIPNADIKDHDITDSEFGQQLLSSLIEENGTNTIEITNDNGIGRTITAKYLTHA